MKDIVTYETAVRLKEAGFPQPTPEDGQFWYNPNGILFVVYVVHEVIELHEIGRRNTSIGNYWEYWTFAPTATDILRELKSDFDLSCLIDVNWMLIQRQTSDQLTPIDFFIHKNPAEAAAEAWIKLNDKK